MRKVIAISFGLLATALICYSFWSADRAWPPKRYTEVRAFLYNLDSHDDLAFVTNGHLDPSVTDANGVKLSGDQVSRFLAAVTGKHPMLGVGGCYIPHHAFVFYDRKHRIVGWVELCFGCFNYRASSPNAPPEFDLSALASLTRELGLPVLKQVGDYEKLKAKDPK